MERPSERNQKQKNQSPRAIRRNKKLGFLGDSHLKSSIMSPDIECSIMETKGEGLIRVRGGATLEELRNVDTETFRDAEGMVISGGQRELLEQWRGTDQEKEQLVESIADQGIGLADKYLETGIKVLYVPPPISRKDRMSCEGQEYRLEQAVKRKAPEGMMVAEVATKMKRSIERLGEEKAMEDTGLGKFANAENRRNRWNES